MRTLLLKEDKENLIKNPGMGWVLYLDTMCMKEMEMQQYWDLQEDSIKYASIFYLRIEWSRMEPEEGIYAWEHDQVIKDLIAGARERGLKLAFRIFVDSMHAAQQATPEWVRLAGAKGYFEECPSNGNNFWNPYVTDSVFQNKFENFLDAFSSVFDDSDTVDFIDANGLGWWGESHNLNYLDSTENREVYEWITSAYADRFHNVLLGDQYQKDSFSYALRTEVGLRKNGYMIRRDSLGSPKWFDKDEKMELLKHWPDVQVFGENCYHHLMSNSDWYREDGFDSLRDCLTRVIQDAKEIHANTLDLRIPEDAKAWVSQCEDLVEDFAIAGGYRLVPITIEYDEDCRNKSSLLINHVWKNTGIGKLPSNLKNWHRKYQVSFALMDEQKQAVAYLIKDQADSSEWIKGKTYAYQTVHKLDGIKPGHYQLAVGITDNKKNWQPDIQLAIKGIEIMDGWYILGEIEI